MTSRLLFELLLITGSGQDPKWAKPPAWAKKEDADNSIPTTESHVGEGKADAGGATDGHVGGEQTTGHTQPAAQ